MDVLERIKKNEIKIYASFESEEKSNGIVVELIELAQLVQRMQWVSVHEDLPKHQQKVDIFVGEERVCNVSFMRGDEDFGDHFYDWDFDNIYRTDEVSHWMPLPPDPKGEEQYGC